MHSGILRLSLCVSIVTPVLCGAPLTKGPYLQAPGPTTMTIRWEALANEPGMLKYGEGTSLDRTMGPLQPIEVKSSTKTTEKTSYFVYEATLKDLKANTTYTYDAAIGSDHSGSRHFKTFGTAQPEVTFIAYGDTRSNPDKHTAVAAHFRRYSPEFILHSGDLVAKGSQHELWSREFFDPLAKVIDEIPMLPSIGNHEQDGANYLAYFREPGSQRYFYSVDIGPVHVVSLDFRLTKATDEQFAFVARDLEASRAPWKIVLLHVPMFNFGGHSSLWGHDTYLPLFRKHHVDLVVAGHSHLYERFKPLVPKDTPNAWAIQHITTGGGGAPLAKAVAHPSLVRAESIHHFIVFTATADRMEAQAIDINGGELDRFTLTKQDGKQPAAYLSEALAEEDVAEAVQALIREKKKTGTK